MFVRLSRSWAAASQHSTTSVTGIRSGLRFILRADARSPTTVLTCTASRGASWGQDLARRPHFRWYVKSAAPIVPGAKGGLGAAAPTTSSLKGAQELGPGAIVEFKKDERAVLSFVVEPDGKSKFWVVDLTGRRYSIMPRQVLFIVPTSGGSRHTQADLVRFDTLAQGLDESLLELTHAVALEEEPQGKGTAAATAGRWWAVQELCDLMFEERQPHQMWATYKLLSQDRLYFKQVSREPLAYCANPQSVVDTLRQQIEVEEQIQQERQGFLAVAKAALSGASSSPGGTRPLSSVEDWLVGPHAHRIQALLDTATGKARSGTPAATLAQDTLAFLRVTSVYSPPSSNVSNPALEAGHLLVALSVWRRHEPLALRCRGLDLEHAEGVVAAAQAVLSSVPPDPDAQSRQDLSHLTVFTVDSATTTEVDDGLSAEQLPGGGVRVWIHVADPTRWLSPLDVLDAEARRRTRTLYLPWGHLPMFPEALAAGPFSLTCGQVCAAMSVGVTLALDGSVAEYRIMPSSIRVTNRLTYEDADALLLMDEHCPHSELMLLLGVARRRQQYRAARGAIEIPLPEPDVELASLSDLDSSLPEVKITNIEPYNSLSRQVVTEMMVLAGDVVGQYGAEHRVPLPYRGQERPALPPAQTLAALPNDLCRAYSLRRCMSRSTVTSRPQRHASLGLDAYVQFTSPIRRYPDLVSHFQIKAHLRGDPVPFTSTSVEQVVEAVAERARDLNVAERESDAYWVSEFFRQRRETTWDALVLGQFKENNDLFAVLLLDLGLETLVRFSRSSWGAVAPGDRAVLVLRDASPWTGEYRFNVLSCSSMLETEEEEQQQQPE